MVSTCHVQRSTVYKGAAPKPVPTGMFSFVMDDSGSMQGARKDDMLEGFNTALGTIKDRKAHDLVAVYPFACRAQCAMGFTLAKRVDPEIIRAKVDSADTGCYTALRDGIALALDSIDRKRQKDFCELMVITDGCENSSSISEQDLREKIRSPGVKNFHLTLVYVGDSPSGVAQLKEIANGIDHVYVLSMKQAKGNFKKAFRTYIQQAQKLIETITVTQTFTRTVHKR